MLSNVACPTAQAVPPGAAATPKRAAPGMWTRLHALPFQWSTSCPWSCQPTAHAESFPAMATPERIFVRPAGLGLLTCFQVLPFQRAVNDRRGKALLPTAQARVAEAAAMLFRVNPAPGERTCRHALPFQCKINVEKTPAATATWPTAHASVGETAATP